MPPRDQPMPLGTSDSYPAAINLATPGATISVAAGSYEEQLDIARTCTSRCGRGPDHRALADRAPLYFTTSANNYPVVYIHGAEVHPAI